jgi:hypothetical protein
MDFQDQVLMMDDILTGSLVEFKYMSREKQRNLRLESIDTSQFGSFVPSLTQLSTHPLVHESLLALAKVPYIAEQVKVMHTNSISKGTGPIVCTRYTT